MLIQLERFRSIGLLPKTRTDSSVVRTMCAGQSGTILASDSGRGTSLPVSPETEGAMRNRAFALVVVGCFSAQGCSGSEGDADFMSAAAPRQAALSERVGAVEELPAFPDAVVVGLIERLEAGEVAASKSVDRSNGTEDLATLLQTGLPDQDGHAYYDVTGAYSDDGITEIRYQYVMRRTVETGNPDDDSAGVQDEPTPVAAPPSGPRPVLSDEVASLIRTAPKDELAEVYIRLKQRLTTFSTAGSQLGLLSLQGAEEAFASRATTIQARKAEAQAYQASVVARLEELGATNIEGFWSSNGIAATLLVNRIESLADHPDVERLSLPAPGFDQSPTKWDGVDIKDPGGLNAGVYHDNGFHGQGYRNSGGRYMRVAIVGGGFDHDHPGFRDCPGCGSNVQEYLDCRQPNCNGPGTAPQGHGTKVAGIVAGSIRQGQITGFTDEEELERTGVAEEPEIYLLAIGGSSAYKTAIEWSITNGMDVLVSSTGHYTAVCDGIAASDLQETIYTAQSMGLIVVQAAGNKYDGSGNCTVDGTAEAVSAFAVGAAGESSSSCTSSNWASCDIRSISERGGMTAVVDGVSWPGQVSLVDALAPCMMYYYFNTTGSISSSTECWTSWAAPQLGGTAILLKDWFLANGHTAINIEGRLFVVMLAMTDRQGGSSYRFSGFDPRWGGGRLQMRYFSGCEPGCPWGWETYSNVLYDGDVRDHEFLGTGTESSSLNQYKVYSMVFEDDNDDMADIDLQVRDDNCSASSQFLWGDYTMDVKSMVRLSGSVAAGKRLCNRLEADHVPSGESRRVHVFGYYSGDTAMR